MLVHGADADVEDDGDFGIAFAFDEPDHDLALAAAEAEAAEGGVVHLGGVLHVHGVALQEVVGLKGGGDVAGEDAGGIQVVVGEVDRVAVQDDAAEPVLAEDAEGDLKVDVPMLQHLVVNVCALHVPLGGVVAQPQGAALALRDGRVEGMVHGGELFGERLQLRLPALRPGHIRLDHAGPILPIKLEGEGSAIKHPAQRLKKPPGELSVSMGMQMIRGIQDLAKAVRGEHSGAEWLMGFG